MISSVLRLWQIGPAQLPVLLDEWMYCVSNRGPGLSFLQWRSQRGSRGPGPPSKC